MDILKHHKIKLYECRKLDDIYKITFEQLITRCEEKYTSWRPALEWMVWSILKITTTYNIESIHIPDDLIINVENVYPLMEDEFEEKALDMQSVNAQTMSRKSFIKKWGKDIDDNAADEELKQIQAEKQMFEDNFSGGLGIGGGGA